MIYKVASWYYSYQYRQILLLKENRVFIFIFCWLERIVDNKLCDSNINREFAVVTGVGGSVDYLALTNNYRGFAPSLINGYFYNNCYSTDLY